MGEWSPENQGGEWVKGATGPAVGAKFKGRNSNGKRSWSTIVEVNHVDAPRKFSFGLMVFGKNWGDWVYEIEPPPTDVASPIRGSITEVVSRRRSERS